KVGDALYFSEDEITGRIDHILSLIEAYEDELAMNELALLKGANIGKSQKKMLEASMEALQRFQYEKARAILMNQ
ncbi:MAG: hypothetical protein PWP24_694, partial [Clostridiales bacterium]|nr:hypothetical protein [Clostridiales bacterium]